MTGLLGWKTVLGSILIATGEALSKLPEPTIMPLIGEGMKYVGTILAGVGLAHKGARILNAVEKNGK